MDSTMVSADVEFRIIMRGVRQKPQIARLTYQREDPLCVSITVPAIDRDPVTLHVARDLLADALKSAVGHGDFAAWPRTGFDAFGPRRALRVCLWSPSKIRTADVWAEPIADFIARTHAVVPMGQEEPIVLARFDAELAELQSRNISLDGSRCTLKRCRIH